MEFKIRMVLIDKDLWEVVDETEKEPAADAPDTRAWQKKDEKHCNYLPLGQGLGARTCTLMQEIGRSLEEVYRTKALSRRRTDARPHQQGYDSGGTTRAHWSNDVSHRLPFCRAYPESPSTGESTSQREQFDQAGGVGFHCQ
jgi:hypothetical protein